MTVNIRKALPSDAERISELLYQVAAVHHDGRPDIFKPASKKYTDEEFEELISTDGYPVLVAECGGSVCGYVFCRVKSYETSVIQPYKSLYIDDLCVDSSERGKGIGTVLFNAVTALAKELDCGNIELNVWEFNTPAMRFYEKMGMRTQRRFMEYNLNN